MKVPRETPMDKAVKITSNLMQAIKTMMSDTSAPLGRHGELLAKLASIFEAATEQLEGTHTPNTPTSATPTTPANIRAEPRVHSRRTRNNIPGILPQQMPPIQEQKGSRPSTEHRG